MSDLGRTTCTCECSPPEFGGNLLDVDCPIHNPRVYKPGDLAFATVRGEEGVVVTRENDGGWSTIHKINGTVWHSSIEVTDLVPAVAVPEGHVVLDPKEPSDIKRFARAVGESYTGGIDILHTLAAEQSRPPMVEPGQLGVVKAKTLHTGDPVREWFRVGEMWADGFGGRVEWAELIDPTLVRPGINDEAES